MYNLSMYCQRNIQNLSDPNFISLC